MNFNRHSNLEGAHAFLGASNYHWINYDEEKVITTFTKRQAVVRGTQLHELASNLITMNVKLPRSNKTLNAYVNDAIGFKMTPEQLLYYSDNCFGTTDTILFRNNLLRIHDLKTGENPASFNQLMVYMALFCLEYNQRPIDIDAELRIYQLDEIRVCVPEPEIVVNIMNKIIKFDEVIDKIKAGG